jgi:Tol biopolymer transport system component
MATGRRAFEGKSQASLIGAIMNTEPTPLSQLAPASPPALDRLVRACLAKDPDERIQTAHDVKLQLRWIQEGGSQSGVPAPAAAGAARKRTSGVMLAIIAPIVGGLAVIAADRLLFAPPPPAVVRFGVPAGAGVASVRWPTVSPDGRTIAFLGTDSLGVTRIYLRPLDAMEARPLAGPARTQRPFWAPDGRSLGYIQSGKVYRLPVGGGAPVAFADAPGGADGSWGKDYVVYDGSGADTLRAVPVEGGKVVPATVLDRARGETGHAWPSFLPDGKHFLFIALIPSQQVGTIKLGRVGSLEARVVGQTEGRAMFANGYLFYTLGGSLLAQRLDARSGKTSGEPVPITDRIAMSRSIGDFGVSTNGMLVYRETGFGTETRLTWADRTGRMLGDAAPPGEYDEVRLSPDGKRVALRIIRRSSGTGDIWVRDLVRNVTTRTTFGTSDHVWPVWSPDGTRLAYASNRGGEFRTFMRSTSGVGGEDSLSHLGSGQDGPTDWSPDGRTIALSRNANTAWDVYLQTIGGEPVPFIETQFSERFARFSPNGRWIVYASNESGRYEVYVVPAEGGGGKWQVSTQGGDDPFWTADGGEILYIAADRSIVAVPVNAGESFEPGTPQPLFRAELAEGLFTGGRWQPTGDGQRFLLLMPSGGTAGTTFTVVSNWPAEFRKKR